MSEYLRDSEVVPDEDADRTTAKIPTQELDVLVAKSTPPGPMITTENEDRISVECAFLLSTPWAAHQ